MIRDQRKYQLIGVELGQYETFAENGIGWRADLSEDFSGMNDGLYGDCITETFGAWEGILVYKSKISDFNLPQDIATTPTGGYPGPVTHL